MKRKLWFQFTKRKPVQGLLSKRLQSEGKLDDRLEILIAQLPLEDLIALKLELSANNLLTKRFLGFPVNRNIHLIVKSAIIHYAFSVALSTKEVCLMLGINNKILHRLVKQFKPPIEHLEGYENLFRYLG